MSTDSIDPEVPDEPVSSEQAPQDGVPSFPTLEEMAALLPQYEFHDILGVGGMGAVYLGRQATLDRWVAIKVLPQSASMNEEDANRFIIEARSMAKLTHAHIVAVYDFGQTSQGHLYLVMEHIDGLDLHRLIFRDEVTQARIRSLVPQLCDALQYAHDHDVIHRDIKPANILITSDWQAKIVDFGLARDKNADSSGEVEYGTPDYVAPERLQTGAQVDHRADIFALGVVIHEMFTKRTPMAAGANVGQGVPADYYSAVKRCTMTDPVQRFQKCSEIKAFLAIAATTTAAPAAAQAPRAPIHATPQRPVIRQPIDTGPQESGAAKWGWAAAVVALLALAGWFLTKNREAEPAPSVVAESKEAEPKKADKDNTPAALVATPGKESVPTTPKTSDTKVMPTAPEATVVTSGPVGPFKVTPGDFSVLKRLTGNSRTVFGSALLPDQRHAIAGGGDSVLRIWDIATGKETNHFQSPIGEISDVIPASDGKRVLIYSLAEDQVCIFDIEKGKSEALIKAPSTVLSQAVWSPDEKSVYISCRDKDRGVYHWDPAKGAVLQQFADWPRGSQQIFPLSATSTGAGDQMLVLGYSTKPSTSPTAQPGSTMVDRAYAALFSIPDNRLIRELPSYTNVRSRLHVSPDGRTLAGGLGTIYLMDLPELTTRSSILPPRASSSQASAFLAGGRLLIAGYSDGSLRLYETETGTELGSLNLESRANRIAVSKDEGWLVISGFPLNSKEAKPEDYDVRIVRLPDLTRLGSEKGYLAFASQQLAKLDSIDPELAELRKKLTPADAITSAEDMKARVLDLNAKYAAALRRDAQRASPADQLAMVAEADAITAGQPMPDPVADASVTGEMKRFRGLYRQQISQLETSRQQSASALKMALEAPIREISNKRSQAGDRLGSALALALLASLDHTPSTSPVPTAVAAASIPSTTTSPSTTPSPAASTAASSSPARLLQRTGKPGTLVKVDRVVKNYYSSNPPRITNIPPDLGPVLEVACSRYHVIALKPDGTLRSWGTWSDRTTAHTIPDTAKDVVSIVATDSSNAALLATGKVVVWSENNNSIWTPPNAMTVTALRKGGSYHNFAICSDGSLHAVTTYSLNDSDAIPSGMTDIADATGYSSNGYFAVKKDGTMAHWGKTNIYIGETHATVKDAVAVAEGNGFLAVIHRDGTIDGWGEASGRQRFRTRKYPGASRILGDPDNRLFFVLKPGNEWAALPNPSVSEYIEEERLSVLEGKLKGCTSVAVAEWVVFGVKP